ncbi:MAG: SOS response-associated peptidase [Gammaproteobacteria bacterium]
MCGRFALAYSKQEIEKYLNIQIPFEFEPRYNIAPTQDSLVICSEDKLPLMMHWGLLPFWAKGKDIKEQINARCEGIESKPMFRDAFKKRRCLVITSGFFEWLKLDKDGKSIKQPFYITPKENHPMIFAGIWERNEEGESNQAGFCILTTEANSMVSKYHQRMPVMLEKDEINQWLNNSNDMIKLSNVFEPKPSKLIKAKMVSMMVNSARNDNPDCIA